VRSGYSEKNEGRNIVVKASKLKKKMSQTFPIFRKKKTQEEKNSAGVRRLSHTRDQKSEASKEVGRLNSPAATKKKKQQDQGMVEKTKDYSIRQADQNSYVERDTEINQGGAQTSRTQGTNK